MHDTEEARAAAPENVEAVEYGMIYLTPGEEAPLSRVAHWLEDGIHHFRSLEFDVLGAGETEAVAVDDFVEWTKALLDSIGELPIDEATDEEERIYRMLSQRFSRGLEVLQERERRRHLIEINIGRWRRATRGNWRPSSASERETREPVSTG